MHREIHLTNFKQDLGRYLAIYVYDLHITDLLPSWGKLLLARTAAFVFRGLDLAQSVLTHNIFLHGRISFMVRTVALN